MIQETVQDMRFPPERLANFVMELRANGIRDTRLLNALERAPREHFLQRPMQALAYVDVELPIACGQSAPSAIEIIRRLARLELAPRDAVLEVGTGTGYQTALLGLCTRRVVSLERFRSLAHDASRKLSDLALPNVVVRQADGHAGFAANGPYDVIVLNGSVDAIPPVLLEQLAPGGRVLAAIKGLGRAFDLTLMHKTPDGMTEKTLWGVRDLPLVAGVATVL
jgi:protein-L-isoaspartate(D-aspartate) O-methyltransferase